MFLVFIFNFSSTTVRQSLNATEFTVVVKWVSCERTQKPTYNVLFKKSFTHNSISEDKQMVSSDCITSEQQ